MVFSALSFLTGIVVVQQFSVLPETIWLLCFLFLALCFTFLRYWRLMFFTVGMMWAIYFANTYLTDRLAGHLQGQQIQVEGKVVGLPQHDERKVRFNFAVSKQGNTLPEKIRLSWYSPKEKIETGQIWQFTVKLKKPHGRFNPGGFDYERWLFMQNIGATGYIRNKPKPRLIATEPLWEGFDNIRQLIANKLTELLKDTDNMGVIKALTIGDRTDISKKQWEVFRKTGTVHLLAISGLHIGLIAGLVYFLALKTSISLTVTSPQKIAAIVAIAMAIFYSALAGFSLPTQRALLMLTIAMAAIFWQRNILPFNTLALALMAVLLFDPLAVLSVGFCLSFLTVVLIIYCLAGRIGKTGYWFGALKIHWSAAIGLAPLLLFYFQQVSIVSPMANFLAVPIISLLVVPLCLIAVILMFFSTALAQHIFFLVNNILQGLWLVLSNLAELPFASAILSSPPLYTIPLALGGALILLSPRGLPARWLGLVLLLPLLFVDREKPKSGEITMTLLDIGQGLSAVIETTNHVLVFDTGAKYSQHYDMGSAVVIPFLKNKAINVVDTLVISHGDNDHIGGADSIIEQIKVEAILTSVPNMLDKYSPTRCQSGQIWVWDQVDFEILAPASGALFGGNNNSCVLKVSSKNGAILLTGDIEAEAENWLLKKYSQQLASNVMVAPHHGSKSSSSLAFLRQVNPAFILIPAGYQNRFSFPHKQVIQRYNAMNVSWFNVAEQGALIVALKKDGLKVNSTRQSESKYWNN